MQGLALTTAPAGGRERRIALGIAIASFAAFVAIVPFVRTPLPRMPAFIPSYEAALFFLDLVTACLLFGQFVRLRHTGILVLASGYLFDALIIVPHALSFPGAFTSAGLLGAREQTTAWLYVFWHGGFSLFVLAYALFRRAESRDVPPHRLASVVPGIVVAVLGVTALAVALTLLSTWGHDLLPAVMRGGDYSMLVTRGVSPAVWVLTLIAMVALWKPHQRVMDLWLMLVMWIWLFDIGLSAVIGSSRFDLGFYAGRLFGLVASGFLLVALILEMTRLHAGALAAASAAEMRFAELARQSSRNEPPRGKQTVSFISRQNITHYRALLTSAPLDEPQRRAIEKLLEEEEAKGHAADPGR